MLGNSALAQTPFAALGGGNSYGRNIAELATGTETEAAIAVFAPSILEALLATDAVTVNPSIFNAPLTESASGTDTITVGPSTFSAPVTESASGLDRNYTIVEFLATI